MQEVEIDHISLEGIETRLEVGAYVLRVDAFGAPSIRVPTFRDDDHVVSDLRPLEPPPQDSLTGSSTIVSCRVNAIAANDQPLVQQFVDEFTWKTVKMKRSKYQARHAGAKARHLRILHLSEQSLLTVSRETGSPQCPGSMTAGARLCLTSWRYWQPSGLSAKTSDLEAQPSGATLVTN